MILPRTGPGRDDHEFNPLITRPSAEPTTWLSASPCASGAPAAWSQSGRCSSFSLAVVDQRFRRDPPPRREPMIVGSVHVAQRSMHGRRSPEQIEMHGTRTS